MISFFPSHYFDETLYSQISRYHNHAGNTCTTHTNRDLFSCNKAVISHDFPSSINKLIRNISNLTEISSKDIIEDSSLVPLYRPFWPQERINNIINIMCIETCRTAHLKAGINGSMVSQWEYLRFCPECILSDKNMFGEAYWHRIHQVPGILICPTHEEWIKDSNIKKFEINPESYYCADTIELNTVEGSIEINKKIQGSAIGVAKDIQWILNSNIKSQNIESIKAKYLSRMKELGLANFKGRIDQKSLLQDFIKYYTEEFLAEMNLMPDIDNPHNWLSMMARKCDVLPHPLKHILLIRYLYQSAEKFFNKRQTAEKKLFKLSLFPCLNPICEHYLNDVITDYEERYSRNNNLYCVFTCKCGFSYIKNQKSKSFNDKYKYSTIKDYGDLWKEKLIELVETENLHLRAVAKVLKVDLSTIRKQVAKLNLNTEYMHKESKSKFSIINSLKDNAAVKDAAFYREKWLELIYRYPDFSKTALKKENSHIFNWLNYHDKQWLLSNSPQIKKHSNSASKIDWSKRDLEIKQKVYELIRIELQSDKKPHRITIDYIGDKLSMLYLLKNGSNKLPETKKYIEGVIETRTDFQKRKIHWAAKYLINNGEEVKEWRIRELAGVTRVKNSEIKEAIMVEIDKQ